MRAGVFGLDVHCSSRVPVLAGAARRRGGHPLALDVAARRGRRAREPRRERVLCSREGADGGREFSIAGDPASGYELWGRGSGRFVLSPDAHRLHCFPEGPVPTWQRFLIGQVLPFASLLAGFEILHASAVVLRGRTVALTAPSGAGKTSLALELCRRGGRFLTDDVLALEKGGGPMPMAALIAHPGVPVAGLALRERERLRASGTPLPGRALWSDEREQLRRMPAASQPAPMRALFFLERSPVAGGPEPRFLPAATPSLLFGASFNFVLDSPQRMRGLLEVCAALARLRVERVVIPPGLDASRLAEAILERVHRA